jgi:glycosyltransferase involved in cell wall biosynthesis
MTGIAELYLVVTRPYSKDAWTRFRAIFRQEQAFDQTRFVVLAWKRTGSNLLCGILFHHPEITMHNELFNPIDIFTYYHQNITLRNEDGDRWNTLGRDLYPEAFLYHIWNGRCTSDEQKIIQSSKAVGFKSFPDHWTEPGNQEVFEREIMEDHRVKKVILVREDELAVYVSMQRAEKSGRYMTGSYPKHLLVIHVDPVAFQVFVDNYWDTYHRRYKSAFEHRDSFWISYEQITQEASFEESVLPLLWKFLGVNDSQPLKKLRETLKQAAPDEDLSKVISNYEELEFCFRHTQVKHFRDAVTYDEAATTKAQKSPFASMSKQCDRSIMSWSLLLPICSRIRVSKRTPLSSSAIKEVVEKSNKNRLIEVAITSQYQPGTGLDEDACWQSLVDFAESLKRTSSPLQLQQTECIVGIDIDDAVFNDNEDRIRQILPCTVTFVVIMPEMYGRVCTIWNHLARKAKNDFIVLLGDDIVLKDCNWQEMVADKFSKVAKLTGLPFGAACVALNDESFPGFPTFPVVHRWHMQQFQSLLPKQFINQGGDPYLFELYSRFNASSFAVDSRLKNTIGGDDEARYKKHEIAWKGQVLRLSIMQLAGYLQLEPKGVCLDVVVPCFRTNNLEILESIMTLSCSVQVYVKFWIVVDNPDPTHVDEVSSLAKRINEERFHQEGNFFVNVLEYGENRGASYARNLGYNYSTADWVLFLDDDVIPSRHILDAYVGGIRRYPEAKVFVGLTELPTATNTWTKMLRTCNIMFFYGIAEHMTHPPWGVTANLMVRGSRFNHTIQFKHSYPKTGGGEDIDFIFQFKRWRAYKKLKDRLVVSVPGAKALHPWWRGGKVCYSQINGWAWGDSLCLTEWPDKTFRTLPNWVEMIAFLVVPFYVFRRDWQALLVTSLAIAGAEHLLLTFKYYPYAARHVKGWIGKKLWVAFGAGTVLSSQEITRVAAHIRRGHLHCLGLRMDWNDGQNPRVKLDVQLNSVIRTALYVGIVVVVHCLSIRIRKEDNTCAMITLHNRL